MSRTTEQPTNQPTAKVTAAGAGGALGILIVFLADQFGVDMEPAVAAAITTLIAFAAGYFKRERVESTPRPTGELG